MKMIIARIRHPAISERDISNDTVEKVILIPGIFESGLCDLSLLIKLFCNTCTHRIDLYPIAVDHRTCIHNAEKISNPKRRLQQVSLEKAKPLQGFPHGFSDSLIRIKSIRNRCPGGQIFFFRK